MNNSHNSPKLGMLLCTFSAVAYTVFNVCLRAVSEQCDSTLVNSIQSSVSVAVFGVYLAWRAARGRRVLPPWNELVILLAIGLITQLGNILFIWAMSVVGVAVTATIQMGVTLAASAVLGLVMLGENVSARQTLAIVLITASVVAFSVGTQSNGETATSLPAAEESAPALGSVETSGTAAILRMLAGVTAAVVAGIAFAILTIGVRKTVSGDTSPGAVVFFINLLGVIALGPWCVYQLGPEVLVDTPMREFFIMLAAGTANLIAFFLVTKSLQLTTVVRVNVLLNGLITVLTVAVGILFFTEPWSGFMFLGIILSLAGIVLISAEAVEE